MDGLDICSVELAICLDELGIELGICSDKLDICSNYLVNWRERIIIMDNKM